MTKPTESKPIEIDALLIQIKNNPDAFITWIENSERYAALRHQARQGQGTLPSNPPFWKRIARFIRALVVPDVHGLHGNAYVDDTLKKDITIKAHMIGAINAITLLPAARILIVPFSGLGLLSIPAALTFSSLGLAVMNWMAQRVITEYPREPHKRWVNLAGVALLQAAISILAGPALYLTTDGDYLTQLWAVSQAEDVITSRHEAGLKQASLLNTIRQERQTRCDALKAQLADLPEGHPQRNLLFIEAFGLYSNISQDRSQIPTDQLQGECYIAGGYGRDIQALQQQLLQEEAAAQATVREMGPLVFLQQQAPDVYAVHFSESGDLLSGTRKVQLATDLFIQKVNAGEIGAVLIPLLLFAISLITSAVMILKLASFRQRADVQHSFDSRIALLRDELFYQAQMGLLQQLQALEKTDTRSHQFRHFN